MFPRGSGAFPQPAGEQDQTTEPQSHSNQVAAEPLLFLSAQKGQFKSFIICPSDPHDLFHSS